MLNQPSPQTSSLGDRGRWGGGAGGVALERMSAELRPSHRRRNVEMLIAGSQPPHRHAWFRWAYTSCATQEEYSIQKGRG